MMKVINRLMDSLEGRWVVPSYGGWVVGGIALCFFGAATNTMAGWLYVLSGMMAALLILGAILPVRSLKKLQVQRKPILPISVGDQIVVELLIENPTSQPKVLLQVQDLLPFVLGQPQQIPLEVIEPQQVKTWTYYHPVSQRGIYRWHEVSLRSATPLGLFWCRRVRQVPAKAIVYPQVLPLSHCPLIDNIGRDEHLRLQSDRLYQTATEGITRGLRPYRQGDPFRLIHWRSSARYGELQIRELEVVTGGQDVIIALDTGTIWESDLFEKAVIAAASLYFYATRSQLNVKLWTAATGLIHGNRVVLETLAATCFGEDILAEIPDLPLVWLTFNGASLNNLPSGSRWLVFSSGEDRYSATEQPLLGLNILPNLSLQEQLQMSLLGR